MIEIRSATVGDATVLSELWTSVGLAHRPHEVADELHSVLSRDPDLVLIAQDDRGVIGSVFGAYDGRRGWLNRLATRPDARGEGVAGALVAALESALRTAGCRKLNLLVTPDNAGVVSFYRRHGYQVDELIFMEKLLSVPAGERSVELDTEHGRTTGITGSSADVPAAGGAHW